MPTSFQSMRLDISSDFWEAILWDVEPISENWNQKISRSQKKVCFYRQKNKLLLTKQMHLGIVEVISARQALQFVCLASSPACQICFPNTYRGLVKKTHLCGISHSTAASVMWLF